VAVSRRLAALEPVADAVRAQGRRALPLACDVADAGQVDGVVARTLDSFGRIDLLVNNAGYRIRSRLEDLPRHEWDAMVGTNLTGVFLLSQAVGRVMIRQRAGKIVNVTSVAGRTGSRGLAAYAATKAGVMVLTQSLGAEWAKHGITVNAVAPGPVETEGVLEVWKTPEMIAQASREVPAPAPRPPRGDRLGGDLRRLRPGQLHDGRDRLRQRRPSRIESRGLSPFLPGPSPALGDRRQAEGARRGEHAPPDHPRASGRLQALSLDHQAIACAAFA
jgi:NAD(P)-dependent dehydrogenase (short-subunit alcohol dehydrogenase family)